MGKKIKADDYKLIDIEEALIANEDWADMGYNLPPVAEGTKAYNVDGSPIWPSNRGAGSTFGHQLRQYPNGTKIRINITDD